jgi:hypothetical protein
MLPGALSGALAWASGGWHNRSTGSSPSAPLGRILAQVMRAQGGQETPRFAGDSGVSWRFPRSCRGRTSWRST